MTSASWLMTLGLGVAFAGLCAGAGTRAVKVVEDDGTIAGRVRAVTLSRLTLEPDAGDWSFAVNADTDVQGETSVRASRAWGSVPITAFVQPGDTVRVTFVEVGGAMVASHVRVAP